MDWEKLFSQEGKKKIDNRYIREMLFLAEQSKEGNIKVLPGKEWAYHYGAPKEEREEKLEGLLSGKLKAEEVEKALRPDALVYNIEDLEKEGLESVRQKILNSTAYAEYYDYSKFVKFAQAAGSRGADLEIIEKLYAGIAKNRVQKKLLDAYGTTGRRQLEGAIKGEAKNLLENIGSLPREQKVLSALRMDWLHEKLNLISSAERDQAVAALSGDERALYNDFKEEFRNYLETGDDENYSELVKKVVNQIPEIKKTKISPEKSESMKELEEELKEYKEEVDYPGTENDPAIPPEDDDEYHTPPHSPGESKEKVAARPIFEVTPPLAGYYASGRKSYYDIDRKTWSKKKRLVEYKEEIKAKDSYFISGVTNGGIKSIPLPVGYAIDMSQVKSKGEEPKIHRDQNGCFYLETSGRSEYSISFYKEDKLFSSKTISQDTEHLYQGALSQQTEAVISKLVGSPIQKAEQVRQYILANHFYPGGGDLQLAQALQAKLRHQSSSDNYLQNIDKSEYLECYSANTLFISMVRKAGVPARLIVGYRVDGAKKGKAVITESTGHAWSEIWDGQTWRRFDATPAAKPEDHPKDKGEGLDQAEKADDDGVPSPQESQGKAQKGEGQTSEEGKISKEADDKDLKNAESELNEAKETLDKMTKEKEGLEQEAEKVSSFKELKELQEKLEKSELLEDMKENIEDKLEAKEEQMKKEIEDNIERMADDGFLDEAKKEKLLKELEEKNLIELDKLKEQIERENALYEEYERIKDEIMPLVDEWFDYFTERLPHSQEIETDEDSVTRQGTFDRKAVMKARNLIFGTVKKPRIIRETVKPMFLASIMVDTSGSMGGSKLENARKLLIFYSELFTRLHQIFDYTRFSINTFSDNIHDIKTYDQEYDSPKSYDFSDGKKSTIKVRLMTGIVASGGTNMLDPIKKAASELNREAKEYPDYASAFYFVGDGEDTNGNSNNVRKFLEINDKEHGFGEHMRSAIMLGNESQRQTLAQIFGGEHTTVAPDFDSLIEQSMIKFEEDIEEYLKGKVI